jgi:O-antigen/teichoic acid export membrane protein
MAQLSVPIRWVPGYLQRARTDSLVRNSLYIMASTIVTAGLGYIFWAFAAHEFTSQEVGISSAVISLCSTAALLTYLGSSAILIERLPLTERSSEWTAILIRVCFVTAAVTAIATAVSVPILHASEDYRSFFNSEAPIIIAVVGAAAWTLVNLLGAAFIAARRAGRFLSIQSLVSAAKVLLVIPLAAAGFGARGLVLAWVGSAILGAGAGITWLVPGMKLGRRPGLRPRRRASVESKSRSHLRGNARHRRGHQWPNTATVGHWLGQHLTSVGGTLIPLLLPVLVVIRLGVTQNAYFYITQMMGAAFFMVSPSVAQAVFAEGSKAQSDLRTVVVKALKVIAALLIPAIVIMIVGGRLILGFFGASYSRAGYGLLVLLALAALPDAVSNVGVVVCRVSQRLGYSAVLNLTIGIMTLGGAWALMPKLGILGVGVAWLAAQSIGAIASLPTYSQLRRPGSSSAADKSTAQSSTESIVNPGIAQLIELAEQQSLDRLSGRLP